jgi:hypothetical protein
MTDLYMARVFVQQARARRGNPAQRSFRATLLSWAAERRRNHIAGVGKMVGQLDLFGGAA